MAESGKLVFRIEIDNQGKAIITDAEGQIKRLQGTATGATSKMSAGFADTWKTMAMGVTAALGVGAALVRLTKDALEAEVQQSRLNVALERSGENADGANARIDDFANMMEYLTGIDDDQIESLEILARQYEIQTGRIDEAIQASIGLTEIGGTLEGNLKAVANAYNGNWRELSALIPELKSANSESERMEILQRAVASGFEMSTSAMQTNAGKLKELSNWWDDVTEKAGGAIVTIIHGAEAVRGFRFAMSEYAREQIAEQQKLNREMEDSITLVETAIAQQRKAGGWNADATPGQLGFIDVESDLSTGYLADVDAGMKFSAMLDDLEKKKEKQVKVEKSLAEVLEERWRAANKTYEQDKAYADFIMAKLGPAIESASDAWANDVDIMKISQDALDETSKSLEGYVEKTLDSERINYKASKSYQELNAMLEFSNALFGQLENIIPGIGTGFTGLIKGVMDFTNALETTKEGITKLSGGLGTFLTIGLSVVSQLTQAFGNFFDNAISWAEQQMAEQKFAESMLGKSEEQMRKDAEKSFTNTGIEEYIAKVKEAGTEGTAAVMKIIDANRSLSEVQEYVNGQMEEAAAGYADYLEAGFSKATIGALDEVLAYQKKVGENQVLMKGVEGMTEALVHMSNGIELNEVEFDKFEQMARDGYDALIAKDFTERQSLTEMAPMLSRLVFLQKEYGLTVDAATQALIDKAKAEGVNLDQYKSQEEIFASMDKTLREIADTFAKLLPKAIGATTDAFKDLNNEAGNFNPGGPGPNPRDKGGEIPAAGGFEGWVAPRSNTRFVTGEDEAEYVSITPASQMRGAYTSPRAGSDAAPVGRTTINNIHLHNVVDPDNVLDVIVEGIDSNRRQVRSKLEGLRN